MEIRMSSQYEKRRHPRTRVTLPVMIETSRGFTDAKILNISANGAFIIAQNSFKLTNKFYMAIANVAKLYLHIPVEAELIRSNSLSTDGNFTYRGLGVRFTKISTEDQEFISALISGRLKK